MTTVGDTFYNFLCLSVCLPVVGGLSGTLGKQNFDPVDLTNEPHAVCSLLKRLKEEGTPQQGFASKRIAENLTWKKEQLP